MRVVCRVFGYEVFSVGLEQDVEVVEETPTGITGGSGANFERDLYPPTEEQPYEDHFGF